MLLGSVNDNPIMVINKLSVDPYEESSSTSNAIVHEEVVMDVLQADILFTLVFQ